ncbi:unnamed protein product [Closterium sp. NIES-64]|nr:unnamed protein product [Closterium sp. NIES-64]
MALERMVVGDLAVRLAARGGAVSDERGGGAGWERRTDVLCESGEEGAGEGGDGTESGEGKEGEKRKCGLINAPDDGVVESTHATADAGGGAYGMESTATPPRAASCDVSGAEVGSEGMQQATQQPLARSAIPKSVTTPSSASHFALGAPLSWAVLPDSVSSFLHSPTPLHHSGSDAAILLASDPASHAVAPLSAAVSPYGLSLPAIQDTAEGEVAAAQARQDAEVRGSRCPAAISHQLLKHPEEVEEGECDGSGLWSTRSERLFPPAWARSPLRTGGTRHEEHGEVARAKARRARGEGGSQAETGMLKMHTVNVAILAREANARQERLAEALRGVRVRQTKPSGAGAAEKAEKGTCKMEAAGGRQKHRHRRGGSVDLDARTPLKERTSRNQTIQGGKCNFVEDEFMGIVEDFLNRPKAKTVHPKGSLTRMPYRVARRALPLVSYVPPRRPLFPTSYPFPRRPQFPSSPSPTLAALASACRPRFSSLPLLPRHPCFPSSPLLPRHPCFPSSPLLSRHPRFPSSPLLPRHPRFFSSLALLLRVFPCVPLCPDSFHPLPCSPPSPSLLPPTLCPAPPIPFPASPHPLPCSPPSPSLLPPTLFPAPPHPLPCSPTLCPASPHPIPCFSPPPALLLPIPFPASPHPLPCFPPSPSLLPPIPFPASPHPLPCFPPSPSLLLPIRFPASPYPLPCFPLPSALLPPIPFPASPHPLPCFSPSPSLLPPIPFPASPHPVPCFPPSPSVSLCYPFPCPFSLCLPTLCSYSFTLAHLTACRPYRLPTLPPSLLIRAQVCPEGRALSVPRPCMYGGIGSRFA